MFNFLNSALIIYSKFLLIFVTGEKETTLENNNKIQEDNDNLDLKKKESESEILDQKKELEKIRQSHIKQYSFYELFKKSLYFSTKNIRLPLFNIIRKFICQKIDTKIPIIYGKLLNTIIKEKNYDKLCSEFRKHALLLFLKVLMNEVAEIFGLFFVKNSMYQNKKIVVDNIAEKDIEFFDLYRTGEITDRIRKNENILDNNFIYKTVDLN